MGPVAWGMLILLSIVWGCTFFFQEIAVKELPVFTIVAMRVVLAATILFGILAAARESLPRGWKVWRELALLALINNVIPFCLIVWGQKEIASGLASILNATTPVFTVLVAHFVTTDEKLSSMKLIGVISGLLGATILIGVELLEGLGTAVIAQVAVLGAALSYGISAIYGRRFLAMGITPTATATGQLTAASFILVPVALVFDAPWRLQPPAPATIAAVIGLASVSTALAYYLYFRILKKVGATNLMLVTFLIPVSALALGIFVLEETLMIQHVIGLLFIGLGLAFLDGRLFNRTKRNP